MKVDSATPQLGDFSIYYHDEVVYESYIYISSLSQDVTRNNEHVWTLDNNTEVGPVDVVIGQLQLSTVCKRKRKRKLFIFFSFLCLSCTWKVGAHDLSCCPFFTLYEEIMRIAQTSSGVKVGLQKLLHNDGTERTEKKECELCLSPSIILITKRSTFSII